MNRCLVFAFALILLAGCATRDRLSSHPQPVWPTTRGAISSSAYAVPVYRSWPDRAYRVLTNLSFPQTVNDWKDTNTSAAAQTAKDLGGDAMVLHFPGEFSAGNETDLIANPRSFSATGAGVLVIKWKSPDELAAEKKSWDKFCERFRSDRQNPEVSDEFLDLAAGYAAYRGFNVADSEDATQLASILNHVRGHSSAWLYRGVLHVSTQKTSYTDTIYGVATLTYDGNKLAIVSRPGKAAIALLGTARDSRITGQFELTAGAVVCPSAADGVWIANKISLDTRGKNQSDVVRGSFTFVR